MFDQRLVFDTIPETFDKYRARYSQELFDFVTNATGLGKDKSCLEIGPGTGQATGWALDTGCKYLAIELGEHLAAFMRQKYGKYENFSLVNADFETYPLEKDSFDLIYSAATIQWIKEDIAYQKCYNSLKSGGYLAMFYMSDSYKDSNPELYTEIRKVYDQYYATDAPYKQKFHYDNGTAYGFKPFQRYEFYGQRVFTAEDFVGYLSTHADHIMLKKENREAFFGGMYDAVMRHGNRIVFDDKYVLYLYQK